MDAVTFHTPASRYFTERRGPVLKDPIVPPNPEPCSCPRCHGWLYAEPVGSHLLELLSNIKWFHGWDLKCINCGRVTAEWYPDDPQWRWVLWS